MSLDVYLTVDEPCEVVSRPRIFVREGGQIREITRAEWDKKFPEQEPVTVKDQSRHESYWANITHNLNRMASEAGIYEALWRPDENGFEKAGQLIAPLQEGLERLEGDPERFKEFNPSNGWGTYEGLVVFVRDYLEACKQNLDASVSVSR